MPLTQLHCCLLIPFVAFSSLCMNCCSDPKDDRHILWKVDQEKTDQYIASLDPVAIELRGSDFLSPRYDPTRIGKSLEEIDADCDYDFEQLAEVEAKLEGVDRTQTLNALFQLVTKDATTNKERHLAMLKFLHRASYHSSRIRPMYEDCNRCWDPLVILEVNEMHCTHTARLVYDIWQAAGYDARLVQFGIKCSAEVYYDDAWHYFGADSVGGDGIVLFNEDGTIPSWRQLSENPSWIDVLPYRYELRPKGGVRKSGSPYRSIHCFHKDGGNLRSYKFKKQPPVPGEYNYGWEDYLASSGDWEYEDRPYLYQPGPPIFKDIQFAPTEDGQLINVTVTWNPAIDQDGDLLGYRVYLGSKSRDWHYQRWAGNKKTLPYWTSDQGWKPEMYSSLYKMPPDDLGVITTSDTQVTFQLTPGETVYITAMSFDSHGELIEKEMYLQSNEIKIQAPTVDELTQG